MPIDGPLTIILAHGAWADGSSSSWAKVINALRFAGASSIAAPLPLTSFADDVAALERVIERAGPVVLVGHAYTGAVIGEMRTDKVKGLVHVAALAPDQGETVTDVFYRSDLHPLAPKLVPDDHGLLWLPEAAFRDAVAPDALGDEQAVLFAMQRSIAIGCITAKVGRPLWRDRPAWFLLAEADRMIAAETQRYMAERMKAEIRSHAVDHAPSVTAPQTVVDVILEAARTVAGP